MRALNLKNRHRAQYLVRDLAHRFLSCLLTHDEQSVADVFLSPRYPLLRELSRLQLHTSDGQDGWHFTRPQSGECPALLSALALRALSAAASNLACGDREYLIHSSACFNAIRSICSMIRSLYECRYSRHWHYLSSNACVNQGAR